MLPAPHTTSYRLFTEVDIAARSAAAAWPIP